MTSLCRDVVSRGDLLGAVVTMMTGQGAQEVLAASDQRSRAWEEIQFAAGEGPGRDAFVEGRPVLVSDLTELTARWPGYVQLMAGAGVGAVFTFPLQLGALRFGVLSCYSGAARSLSPGGLAALLDRATYALELLLATAAGAPPPSAGPAEPSAELEGAIHLRSEIYQAQGMVMAQLGVSLAEALALMRAHAFAHDTDLAKLAQSIVSGTAVLVPE